MKKTASEQAWLKAHRKDPYAKQAKVDGYRSRATYKLLEIHARDHLFKPGQRIIDLGAAPGGWSDIAARHISPQGQVIAIDLRDMPPLPGVTFLQGDFMDPAVQTQLASELNQQPVDIVLSDMAPDTSGVKNLDQLRSMALVETALAFALEHLSNQGSFLVKVFQGAGSQEFLTEMRRYFNKVLIRKPKSSKPSSREVYMLGIGKIT